MNNYQKMRHTGKIIRQKLLDFGFSEIYTMPHLRFQKGWKLDNVMEFDAIGWKGKQFKKEICLFQYKTGKRPSKQNRITMKRLHKIYSVRIYWVTRIKRKVFLYDAVEDNEVEL